MPAAPPAPPAFGTSGLRGLVVALTDAVVAAHVAAFLRACPPGAGLLLGRDLRASSPRIAAAAAAAARALGVSVQDCGELPTPALALAAAQAGAAAVMVTGSHIPDDRNGLKFYTPAGEITKAEEAAITAALAGPPPGALPAPPLADAPPHPARATYAARVQAFGPGALAGLRLGVWQHSTVARDLLVEALAGLGAVVVPLGRVPGFLPLDTEAVDAAARAQIRAWCAGERLDALVSADGDGDRPLMAGPDGALVPGDLLGLITARLLGAGVVVTPLSSSTALELSGAFARVIRTRIGSPHVIAAMQAAAAPAVRVAGFEANGGFLLGFPARLAAGTIAPLPTRDALLPLVAVLVAARAAGGLPALLAALPARATAADRLAGIDRPRAEALLARLLRQPAARAALFGAPETALDTRDGLRARFAAGHILHLRLSGNAPELRCYAEAATAAAAEALLRQTLARVAAALANEP